MAANRSWQWAAGIVCICCVAVLWTGATVLKQIIFKDLDYNEPLVLSYVCNACYVFHLPLFALGRCVGLVKPMQWSRTSRRPVEASAEPDGASPGNGAGCVAATGDGSQSFARDAVLAGLTIAPVWFFAQWTYSSGVAKTSVTSSTVISATSVVWTLIGSILFAGERLNLLKALGVACCLAGNVATQLGDFKGSFSGQALGDMLCLGSAVLYAVYTTTLKKMAGEDVSVVLLFGTIGLVIGVLGLPCVLLFDYDALDRMTPKIFGLLIFNGIFDNVLSQYLWAKAVQWISPTAATVGLSLTIPLSIVADIVRSHPPSKWSYLAGVLVVVGFISVTMATRPEATESESMREPARAVDIDRSPLSPAKGDCEQPEVVNSAS